MYAEILVDDTNNVILNFPKADVDFLCVDLSWAWHDSEGWSQNSISRKVWTPVDKKCISLFLVCVCQVPNKVPDFNSDFFFYLFYN